MATGLLAIVVAVGGCSSGSDGTRGEARVDRSDVASRIGYDIAGSDLTPVFAAVPQYKDPREAYARDLLARDCLRGIVEYRVEPPKSSEYYDERTGQGVFDERVAQKWGYSASRVNPAPDTAVRDSVTITPEINQKMIGCGKATDRRLGRAPEKTLTDIETAGWDAVTASPEIARVNKAWKQCMLPAGVADLPDGPHEMPSPSVRTRGTGAVEDSSGNPAKPVSAREIEVAKADAACRDKVEFSATELRVRAKAELEAIGRDVEGFEAAREAYATYGKGVDKVIAELGG
jgi:hypothetical protein